MSNVIIRFTRPLRTNELEEVLAFAKNQETTDKYTDTTIEINGDYAKITLEIDEDGDFTVL